MRTLSLVTAKGGSGKSSLAASIAAAAAGAGEKVAVLDLDPQGTLLAFRRRREADDIEIRAVSAAALRRVLTDLADGFTLAIVDTPGLLGPGIGVAIQQSDFALVPVRPSIVDVDGATATVAQLKTLRVRFGLLLNAINPSTPTRTVEAAEALARLGHLAPLVVGNRVDFADAMMSGQGVTELAPHGKAAAEIIGVWEWTKARMEERT